MVIHVHVSGLLFVFFKISFYPETNFLPRLRNLRGYVHRESAADLYMFVFK